MKLIFVFFITIILCSCSECNESTASVQKEPSLEEKLSAYNEDSQFFPAVFAGVESLPDGTQMLLVRTYDKAEPEPCLDAYKTVVAPDAPYEDRFIPVQTQDTGLWTFADVCRSGMHIAPAVFEQVHPFKDGLGAVRYNGYWGFIDGSGHLAVQCSFLSVQDFFNDISIVSFLQDGKKWWGGIDKKGCILFSIPDESSSESGIERICDFHEYECAKGVRHNMECMISRDGSILLHNLTLGSIEFQSMKDDCFVFSFGNGTLCVRGVFDEERYSQTGKESSSTLYGAFDRSGKWIVEPVHQSYETVQKIIKDSGSEGTKPFRVRAVQDRETSLFGLADEAGTWLLKAEYEFILPDYANKYFILMTKNGKYGIADSQGHIAAEALFDDISCIHTRPLYFCACQDGKYGLVDENGSVLYPFNNDSLISFE